MTEWAELLSTAGSRSPTAGGLTIQLGSDPGLAARAADLAVREQRCCPFFGFSVDISADGISLTVRAPDEAQEMVSALFGA